MAMGNTVPDLAYTAASLMALLSGLLSVASVIGTGYGIWTRQTGTLIDKCRDLLAIAKESRNVFLAFMAVLLFTVAPSVKVNDMGVAEAIADLTQRYSQFMIATLVASFVCSALGVFKGPLTQTIREHLGAARLHSLVFAIIGMLMTYVASMA